jgi:DnaJ like chaperone protein
MPFWGKLVGAAAGLATGRPLIGLVGLVLGHQFDRGFAERFRGRRAAADDDTALRLPEHFLRALFQTMGHLAKSDGRVTEAEIRAARALMHRLNLTPAQTRDAVDWFEAGKAKTFPMLATVRRFSRDSAGQPHLRPVFVRLLTEVALSKPTLRARERALLWAVCKELDIGRVELAQLEAMLRAQRAFRQSPAGHADAARVSDAYTVLGVDRSCSNEDIKKAYRRLMNRHHPDKIAATNPDAAAVAAAEKRTRDIRTAYETLKTRRLIR